METFTVRLGFGSFVKLMVLGCLCGSIVMAPINSFLSAMSGEGFVCRYRGPGRVYLQTRQLSNFASQIIPFLPKSSS